MQHRIAALSIAVVLASCAPTAEGPQTPPTGSSSVSSAASAVSNVASSADSVARGAAVEIVALNLNVPWGIAFLPDGDLLVTERPGNLIRISQADRQSFPISGVRHVGEGGLLGVALHPDFASNRFVYLYLTTGASGNITNRVERYRLEDDRLTDRVEIVSGIPGAANHDGGQLAFGPDGKLYVTTGDAQDEGSAQEPTSLAGKILRLNDDGSVPADGPFANGVYSYGHRNPQGLAWDSQGRLWATEHGRSGIASGYDELNMIEKGKNYGWPEIQGDSTREGMTSPVLHSGPSDTWAPASLTYSYAKSAFYFGGLRGESLYEASPATDGTMTLREYFHGQYGRIRAAVIGPDGYLYISTSNTDGRGSVKSGDDRILRIDLAQLR